MTGIISAHSDTTYARTDISGFYKRNSDGSWTQQLDFLLPTESHLMGAAGIAISPSDPDTVYVAAGQFSTSPGELFKTENGGKTWERTAPAESFYFGALEDGRINGEPITVSPHDSDTVFVLTKTNGLWKTTNAAQSWEKVTAFSASAQKTTGFVEVSKTDADTIYVNVSGEGMYKTENGGADWELTENSPTNLRRVAQKSDGTLLCSASDGIYKYDTNSVWSKIYTLGSTAPLGIGGIDIDPFNENHVVAISSMGADGSTGLGNNHIVESFNGGESFTDRYSDHEDATNDNYINPSDFSNKFTAASSIVFDGTRRGTVYVSDWFGVFETENISATPIILQRNTKGIENTLAYAIRAIPGKYSVMAGIADINSYGWTSVDTIGKRMSAPSSTIQDTTEIDYCEKHPEIIVRVGAKLAENGAKNTGLEYTTNGGDSWKEVALDSEIFGNNVEAHVAVSADVNSNGNPTILLSGKDGVYYTTNYGGSWQKSQGAPNIYTALYMYTSPLVSDRVKTNNFYVYGDGVFYRSTDGGKTFTSCSGNGVPSSWKTVQMEASPYKAGHILLTRRSEGVYLSEDYGSSFRKIGDFTRPLGATYGKGRADGGYVIYVFEGSDSKPGIYASEDNATTWTKVGSKGNNFCGMSDMDADKYEFGVIYISTSNRGVFRVKR